MSSNPPLAGLDRPFTLAAVFIRKTAQRSACRRDRLVPVGPPGDSAQAEGRGTGRYQPGYSVIPGKRTRAYRLDARRLGHSRNPTAAFVGPGDSGCAARLADGFKPIGAGRTNARGFF